MKHPGLRILVLLALLAAPVLLAIGSQALAARPGPPEPPVRTPIPLDYTMPEDPVGNGIPLDSSPEPAAPQGDGQETDPEAPERGDDHEED